MIQRSLSGRLIWAILVSRSFTLSSKQVEKWTEELICFNRVELCFTLCWLELACAVPLANHDRLLMVAFLCDRQWKNFSLMVGHVWVLCTILWDLPVAPWGIFSCIHTSNFSYSVPIYSGVYHRLPCWSPLGSRVAFLDEVLAKISQG